MDTSSSLSEMHALCSVLASTPFQGKMKEWAVQRDFLRTVVSETWDSLDARMEFEDFWNAEKPGRLEVKLAMVIAALEDVPPDVDNFLALTCDELTHPHVLAEDPSALPALISSVCSSDECEAHPLLKDECLGSVAVDSLLLMRSVLLCTFTSNILILYNATKDDDDDDDDDHDDVRGTRERATSASTSTTTMDDGVPPPGVDPLVYAMYN